jgi:hypothetical protein
MTANRFHLYSLPLKSEHVKTHLSNFIDMKRESDAWTRSHTQNVFGEAPIGAIRLLMHTRITLAGSWRYTSTQD